MTPFTWRGVDCLIVAPIRENRCQGCLFASTPDDECPHTDPATDANCDVNDNDIIYIANTPDAIAEYMAERLA